MEPVPCSAAGHGGLLSGEGDSMELRRSRAIVPLLLAVLLLLPAAAPAPAGEAMLVVRNLTDPNHPEVRFTEEELKALPQVTIRTHTEFTDGLMTFEGPLARDVIARLGVGKATTLHAIAANDYAVDMPLEELFEYDVVLALYANGERLTMRDKGPIWLVYPIDENPELNDPIYNARMIWQLTTMELR